MGLDRRQAQPNGEYQLFREVSLRSAQLGLCGGNTMPKKVYIRDPNSSSDIRGPFTLDQLRGLVSQGLLQQEHEVSMDKSRWVTASQVKPPLFETRHIHVDVTCPQCGGSISARAAYVGKKVRHDKCGHSFLLEPPAETAKGRDDDEYSLAPIDEEENPTQQREREERNRWNQYVDELDKGQEEDECQLAPGEPISVQPARICNRCGHVELYGDTVLARGSAASGSSGVEPPGAAIECSNCMGPTKLMWKKSDGTLIERVLLGQAAALRVKCLHCSVLLEVGFKLKGNRVKCPRCGKSITIKFAESGQPSKPAEGQIAEKERMEKLWCVECGAFLIHSRDVTAEMVGRNGTIYMCAKCNSSRNGIPPVFLRLSPDERGPWWNANSRAIADLIYYQGSHHLHEIEVNSFQS